MIGRYLTKQFGFIVASLVLALAIAGGLIFYYRLPNSAKQSNVKGATVDQKQQLFESCLAGQLGAEGYFRYKNGDQSALSENFEKVSVCYSILSTPSQ